MTRILVVLALAFTAAFAQERSPAKTPQKGDTVVVKGCLRGSSLESTETGLLDAESRMMTSLVYRLTGDKGRLKQMRQQFDGQVIEVTGLLKSHLPSADGTGGKTIGNTRIRIGSPGIGTGPQAEATKSIPVLEVKSYEGSALKCG